jgi:hydrogenase maturation factor HypF (carbamoyltransferase family)
MNNTCTGCNKPITTQQPKQKAINECMFKMQDGRSFTDYRPRCTINYQMKNEEMQNSYDSRMFLINNAESMMKANQQIVTDKNKCMNCQEMMNDDKTTFLPEKNMMKCDKRSCNFIQDVDASGLGTGRLYK